jgi:pyruvate dehydrogenase E1 component alpha subunit
LIEAFTYRMGAHTTTDDPTRYRLAAELDEWRAKDPVHRVRTYLEKNDKSADSDFFAEVDAAADELAVNLRTAVQQMPDPAPTIMFDHVYEDEPPQFVQQREQFVAYHASFADAGGH